MRRAGPILVAVALAALAGCTAETYRVSSFQLGKMRNADNTVGVQTTTFAPKDTVYLAVLTAGVGEGTISVRWTHAGRVVGEPKKQVKSRDGHVVDFHLESAVGFPPGEYKVEIFLDGEPVGSRAFRVQPSS